MIVGCLRRIDNVPGDPHCIRLSAAVAPPAVGRSGARRRGAGPTATGGHRMGGARTDRCGAVDVVVSPSAALPDGRTGTDPGPAWVPDRRVFEGTPPDDAGADAQH